MSCVIEYNIIAKEVAADVGVGVVDLYAYVEARSFFRVSTRILGKTMRDALRNKEWWKRRHTPTQNPSSNKAKDPFPFASRPVLASMSPMLGTVLVSNSREY